MVRQMYRLIEKNIVMRRLMMNDYNRRTWKVRQMTGLLLAREALPQAEPSTFSRSASLVLALR